MTLINSLLAVAAFMAATVALGLSLILSSIGILTIATGIVWALYQLPYLLRHQEFRPSTYEIEMNQLRYYQAKEISNLQDKISEAETRYEEKENEVRTINEKLLEMISKE